MAVTVECFNPEPVRHESDRRILGEIEHRIGRRPIPVAHLRHRLLELVGRADGGDAAGEPRRRWFMSPMRPVEAQVDLEVDRRARTVDQIGAFSSRNRVLE